jgi:hypothetical protein
MVRGKIQRTWELVQGRGVPRSILEVGNTFQQVRLSKNVDYLIDNKYLIVLSSPRRIVNHKTRLQKKRLSETEGRKYPTEAKEHKKRLEWATGRAGMHV